MELKSALKKLKESKEFIDWSKSNKDSFFSYGLKMIENGNEGAWQLGYYHKSTDKVVTFTVNEEIEMQQEEEIFKKPDMEVKEIDLEKVKLSFKKIMENIERFQKEKYPQELASKTIAILQNLEEYGNIWNITYVTQSFKTLNIKASSETGQIKHHSIESIMDFAQK